MPFVQAEPIIIDTKLVGKQLDEFMDMLDKLMGEAAGEMHRKLSEEPPNQYIPWNPVGGSPPAYKSEKQHIFVVKNIREGKMESPYKRSHELSNAWTITRNRLSKQISYLISNPTDYAYLIHDTATQTYRAKVTKWPTVENVAKKDWPKEAAKIKRAAKNYKPS